MTGMERRGFPLLPSEASGNMEIFMARTAEALRELFRRDANVNSRLRALEETGLRGGDPDFL
jgi:hypothetical protein